jgi:hypothetical protein
MFFLNISAALNVEEICQYKMLDHHYIFMLIMSVCFSAYEL